MNWSRISQYAGRSGEWTITEMIVKGVPGYLLYRGDEIVGHFDTKDAAKAKAEELAGVVA